jgi:hypothetical protein
MKVQFTKKSTGEIVSSIRKTMEGRSLGDLVSIDESGQGLMVKISKLGTSTLEFERKDEGDIAIFTLTTEKIAFAHKAFKNEVTEKLVHVIEKSGGKVIKA